MSKYTCLLQLEEFTNNIAHYIAFREPMLPLYAKQ